MRLFKEEEDLAPRDPLKQDFYLGDELVPAVEELFRNELGDPRTNSEIPCPYRAGKTSRSIPLTLTCECPATHVLIKALGRGVPLCGEYRCPVRSALSQQ